MRLTTKTRYGARAMLDLALHYGEGPATTNEIAVRQEVSAKYLEHLLTALRNVGLVRTLRGAGGGHQLSAPPEQINLRQVFEALEGHEGLVECTTNPAACQRYDECVTREVWSSMYDACMTILESTTLADLARRAGTKQQGVGCPAPHTQDAG
jgi:Rrf2 family transcriptional regulator, cysteine metabolism repressor